MTTYNGNERNDWNAALRERENARMSKRVNAFHVEAGSHMETGEPIWKIVDDRDGVWGEFTVREAATACVKGYRTIGFVPRPGEPSTPSEGTPDE